MEEKSVLFVCLGNVIRSPICEGLFRKLTNGEVRVDSCAVLRDADENEHPEAFATKVAQEHGFDISNHLSRIINEQDFRDYTYIVSLEPDVFHLLNRKKPNDCRCVIIELAPDRAISNPWKCPYKYFIPMYKDIAECMDVFINKYFPVYKKK